MMDNGFIKVRCWDCDNCDYVAEQERIRRKKMIVRTAEPTMIEKENPCKNLRLQCDQCIACMIQGVLCHETGCPNMPSKTIADS